MSVQDSSSGTVFSIAGIKSRDLSLVGERRPTAQVSLQSIADEQVLYLSTIGRTTGLPREIEIWFVVCASVSICSPKG